MVHLELAPVVVGRGVVCLHVAVDRPAAAVVCVMSCVGMQMHEGRGQRTYLHREAHKQDQGQTFHGWGIVSYIPHDGQGIREKGYVFGLAMTAVTDSLVSGAAPAG